MNNKLNENLISSLIKNNSKVLDIGCGNGSLLQYLETNKNINGQGIEISHKGVQECVSKGLSVIQGNADTDLIHFPNNAFDIVILSRTLQATHKPKDILYEMLRIGKKCIVSIPNFGHWKCRLQILFEGKMPMTKSLSSQWYETENIHLCTIKDFVEICKILNIYIEAAYTNNEYKIKKLNNPDNFLNNLLSKEGIFVLTKK
tara:strand:- start:7314 stop:7919 length:606 start_codon:yes stop_codon:yes gene_type:complete